MSRLEELQAKYAPLREPRELDPLPYLCSCGVCGNRYSIHEFIADGGQVPPASQPFAPRERYEQDREVYDDEARRLASQVRR